MYYADLYCPLCNVGMRGWHTEAEELPSNYTANHWYEEIRVVYEERERDGGLFGTTFLSGVGYYIHNVYNNAWVPLDSKLSYRDVGENSLEKIDLSPTRYGRKWGYAIHSSCWMLLRAKLTSIENEADIAKALLYYLYTTPCSDPEKLSWYDDNKGLTVYRPPMYLLDPVDDESDERLYYSDGSGHCPDPSDVLPLNEISDAVAPRFLCAKYWSLPFRDTSSSTASGNNSLSVLPPELIFHIFSYLPLAQVMCMRLVSRYFAQIAYWDNLPQSFWKTRFMLGHEMGFVLPDLSQGRDWARLFRGVHLYLADVMGVLYYRRRVWRFLEFLECLAKIPGMETRELLGHEVSMVDESEGKSTRQGYRKWAGDSSMGFLPVCLLSGRLAKYNDDELMGAGCHELYHRFAQFPSQFPSVSRCEFRVSKIQIGPRSYISGIRYCYSGFEGDSLASLGFCNPPDEQVVGIPPHAKLQEICVAFSRRGLVGIKFDFVGIDDASSPWVGQKEGHDIGFGGLKLPKLFNQYHIVASLDLYKIVGLELVHPTPKTASPQDRQVRDNYLQVDFNMSQLWKPMKPEYHNLSIASLTPQIPDRTQPLTIFDFGGPDGKMLASLTRIAVRMFDCTITGMEFSYKDQASSMVGSSGNAELSFVIDGPGGERVTNVKIITNDKFKDAVCGLNIFTSYGRNEILAAIGSWTNVYTLPELPKGNTITGLVAAERDRPGEFLLEERTFSSFGLLGQHRSTGTVIREPRDNGADPVYNGSNDFRYKVVTKLAHNTQPLWNFRTHAPLVGIRRIGVSRGSTWRARSLSHVSGLMLEYHDGRSPIIVGQWMSEFDSIELARDEALQGIKVFGRPVGSSYTGTDDEKPGRDERHDAGDDGLGYDSREPSSYMLREDEKGPVIAIQVETTHRQHKMFKPPGLALPPFYACVVYEYHRGPREELTGMLWVFNAYGDHVRAFITMKNSQKPPILVPEFKSPSNEVQRFFLEQTLDDGTKDKLKAIVANFRREYLCGLLFVYQSGVVRSAGDGTTKNRREIQFGEGDKIIGFSREFGGEYGGIIEFKIHAEQEDQSRKEHVLRSGSPIATPPDDPGFVEHTRWFHWILDKTTVHQYAWDVNDGGEGQAPTYRRRRRLRQRRRKVPPIEYRRPRKTEFVGFYVSCDEFHVMGALCQPVGT